MATTDGGHDAAKDKDSAIHLKDVSEEEECPVSARPDVEDDERRNSPSGVPAPGNDDGGGPTEAAGYFNPQILRRRPTRQSTDHNEDTTAADDPLPVPVKVELDTEFQTGVPIPNLPHPALDASLKSEAFDDIRRLILATPQQQQEVQEVNEEVEDDLFSSEAEESPDDDEGGQGQGLFAVDSLRFFLGNIRFDDVTMT